MGIGRLKRDAFQEYKSFPWTLVLPCQDLCVSNSLSHTGTMLLPQCRRRSRPLFQTECDGPTSAALPSSLAPETVV